MNINKKKVWNFTTNILHNKEIIKYGATHEAIYNTAAFKYKYAQKLINVFKGKNKGYRYSRQNNPTVYALENKITKMENGISTICFSSGMGAISAIIQSLIKKNDHIISSKFLFSNTNSMFNTIISYGIDVSMIDITKKDIIKNSFKKNTRIFFIETIANPCTQIAHLKYIGKICKKKNIIYIIDNTIASPYIFKSKTVKASLVINSLTKTISGHGNILGGSITDTGLYNWKLYPNINKKYKKFNYKFWGLIQIRSKGLRDFGASLNPESAYYISLGSETLALRQEKSCLNALSLAKMLQKNKFISKIYYPGLLSHPQHKIAKKNFKYYGNLLSFELKNKINYLKFLNNLKIPLLASNLGDNRTLIMPIAQTIYHEMGKKKRNKLGISESLIRVCTGIEDTIDLIYDFKQAFSLIN